jgi:uncharacterized protein
MSTFAETVMEDLKAAMKAKDTVALTTLRALKTALTNTAIESGHKDNVVTDADALAIVRKQITPSSSSKQLTAPSLPKPKRPRSLSSKNTFPPP